MIIGDLIKRGLDAIEEEGSPDNDVFVVAHNGMSEDMQEIDALYIIESDLKQRSAIIHVTWETKSPKEPKEITVEYLKDVQRYKTRRKEVVRRFRENLADGDYCKRDMEMGMIRLRGDQQLYGVAEVINGTLGRNAAIVLAFLEGGEDYASTDLTYDNSWGTW